MTDYAAFCDTVTRDLLERFENWYSRGAQASCRSANTRSPSNHSPLEGESQKPSRFPELVEGQATADAEGGVFRSPNRPPLGQHFRLFDHRLRGLRLLIRRVTVPAQDAAHEHP